MATQIQFPVGQVISSHLYDGKLVFNNDKTPKMNLKTGLQVVEYGCGVAYPKTPGVPWQQTEWGKQIYQVGLEAFPKFVNSPGFSWKITDGDDTNPNNAGSIPAEQDGYPGNWIVWQTNPFRKPIICDVNGQQLYEKDHVYPGCYVQTIADILGNGVTEPTHNRGVFIRVEVVCFSGHGKPIISSSGINVKSIQWQTQLPPGASAVPVAASLPQPTEISNNGILQGHSAPTPPVPNMAILEPPKPPTVHVPQKIMTGAAVGFTLEQLLAKGWTEKMLLDNGMMVIQ